MIQLNLLPDVKLEYIKAQKMRSLVTGIAVVISVASIVILALMFVYDLHQRSSINNNKTVIASLTSEIQNKPHINTILTVQNQLKSLGSLYAARPAAYRLFTNYLSELTPEAVSLNNLNIDFTANTATLTGTADTLNTVNQYIDTLKITSYNVNGSTVSSPAFSNVVLSSFGISQQQTNGQNASFTINLDFSPDLFNSTEKIKLNIPNIVVTHFQQSDTGSLFKAAPTPTPSGGQ
jgi:Tfp pilus assembly protein PilN